jgi:thermostable 8-oxoguanine DNA glycosylase
MRLSEQQQKRKAQRKLDYSDELDADDLELAPEPLPEPEPMAVEKTKAKSTKPKTASAKPAEAKKAAAAATPKTQKELSYEEVSEVLAAIGFLFKARHLKSMARHHKKFYARLLELVKPRIKATSHATPIGRLIYFIPTPTPMIGGGWGGDEEGYYAAGDFATVCDNANVVVLPQYDSAKKLRLPDMVRLHLMVEGQPAPSKNHHEQLYALLAGGFVETDEPQLESKMSECVYRDDEAKKAYWLNTQEGKKALGPVVNAQNIKKLTQEALEKETPKLEQLRVELLALFGEYAEVLEADEAAGKNKRKADDSDEEVAPTVVEKKRRTETGAKKVTSTTAAKPAATAKPAETTETMDVERSAKSTAKPKAGASVATTPQKKQAAPVPPSAPQKKPRPSGPSSVKPTRVTTVTTVQIGEMSGEMRDRIQQMASGEIRAMLSKVGDNVSTTSSDLHEVAWYKKYL